MECRYCGFDGLILNEYGEYVCTSCGGVNSVYFDDTGSIVDNGVRLRRPLPKTMSWRVELDEYMLHARRVRNLVLKRSIEDKNPEIRVVFDLMRKIDYRLYARSYRSRLALALYIVYSVNGDNVSVRDVARKTGVSAENIWKTFRKYKDPIMKLVEHYKTSHSLQDA